MSPTFQFTEEESKERVVSVSELNALVAHCIETRVPALWVSGEVRGFTRAASGHWYFTLKDRNSEITCAMFRGANYRVTFVPKIGDHLEVFGRVTIYQPRGAYQLIAEGMRYAGQGSLYEQFLRLKEKLQHEGLFNIEHKKVIARINPLIAVVTSLKAAALKDVLTTLKRRAPYARVTVFATPVQGEEAPPQIIEALQKADASDAGVVLLVRGGGSLQDLWAFNDEGVARAIFGMTKPVIVGVGHESDVTIADWVADFRAATPTAAAEHATESARVLSAELDSVSENLSQAWLMQLQSLSQKVDMTTGELIHPLERIRREAERVTMQRLTLTDIFRHRFEKYLSMLQLLQRGLVNPIVSVNQAFERQQSLDRDLTDLMRRKLLQSQDSLATTADLLVELSPQNILKKGYSYVTDSQGRVIKRAADLSEKELAQIHWLDGRGDVIVHKVVLDEQ